MRPVWLVLLGSVVLVACGDDPASPAVDAPPADAGVDVPDDPFAHVFDSPDDFPRTGCRAGALSGFAERGVYLNLGLRLAGGAGALRTFVDDYLGDVEVAHLLTDDDLIVRTARFSPTAGWSLRVIHVCDVPAPGVLRGHRVFCSRGQCGSAREAMDERFHRLAGEGEGDGLTLLGELALPRPEAKAVALNVRVDGDVAYLAMGSDGLRTVSLANPRAPTMLGQYRPSPTNFFNDVKLLTVGGRRYAVMAGAPSQVIDVTTPASPQLVAQLAVGAHTVAVEGHHAYLVDGGQPRLWIYDLALPRAPVERAQWLAPGIDLRTGFHDLHVRDGIAYLSTFGRGLTVADVRDPAAPRLLGATATDPEGRYWHSPWAFEQGGRLLVLNGDEGSEPQLRVLDAEPTSPTFLGTVGAWGIPGPVSLHNVMVSGPHGYLVHYQHGVRVLDLSDPSQPRQVGYYNTWREEDAVASPSGAVGLDLDGPRRRIYVADTQRGLLVLEATAALAP